jgi:hypothetical protein
MELNNVDSIHSKGKRLRCSAQEGVLTFAAANHWRQHLVRTVVDRSDIHGGSHFGPKDGIRTHGR